MRRLLGLFLFFLFTLPAAAQNYTTVTATVRDPTGTVYALGTYTVSLVNNTGQQPLFGGNATFQTVYGGLSLDANGKLSIILPSVTVMTPSGLQWLFNVCANPKQYAAVFPQPASGGVCFSYTSTGTQISGSSVDLSSSFVVTTVPLLGVGTADPPITQAYTLTTAGGGAQAGINLTAAPIDTHNISWRFTNTGGVVDTVPYANGDLHTANANWVYVNGSFNVNANAIYGSTAGVNFAYRSDGLIGTADQYSQGTMVLTAASGTQNGGPCVRMSAAAQTAYCIQAATDILRLIKDVAGAITVLQDFSGTTLAVTNDVLRVQAIGTTIAAFRNGALLGSVTDATIATGNTGMFSGNVANSNGIKSFAAGPVCTVALDSSTDGITWTAGGMIPAQFCSPNPNSSVTFTGIANFVRVNVTQLAANQTLNVVYSGRLAPAGAGGNTAPVSNGQYVQAGEVIWFQYSSRGNLGGPFAIHASARITNTNGTITTTNLDPTCTFTTNGGIGFGFAVPSAGWLQSATTYLNAGGFPQGTLYINIYALTAFPPGGNSTTCTSQLTGAQIGMLLAGQNSGSFYPVSFVGTSSIIQMPWAQPGFTTSTAVTNPAAGADFSFSFPEIGGTNGARICVQSVSFNLTTSAAAANRLVLIELLFGTGSTPVIAYSAATPQTASSTQRYTFSPGAAGELVTTTNPNFHIIPFNNGQLACFNTGLAAGTVTSITAGLQAGDQFSNIAILYQYQQDAN